jgi:uncharacterized membrane protein YphA (DoxX/SURF4 family)
MKSSIKNKILFVLALLFGLMFINAGLDKFLHHMPMPAEMSEKTLKAFGAFVEIGWLMPLVGIVEMIGGLLIIIPRTRALGALICLPVMVGILLTNIFQEVAGLPLVIVLCAILAWIMIENKKKYLPLLDKND